MSHSPVSNAHTTHTQRDHVLLLTDITTSADKWLGKTYRKISPVLDWWSTLHNWRFCQLQSHV